MVNDILQNSTNTLNYIQVLVNQTKYIELERHFAGWNGGPVGFAELHSFQRYTVKSAYNYLSVVEVDDNGGRNHVLWLKVVPLKVIFLRGGCLWIILQLRTSCLGVTSWQIHMFYVPLVVILWKIGITYFFNVISTVNFGI